MHVVGRKESLANCNCFIPQWTKNMNWSLAVVSQNKQLLDGSDCGRMRWSAVKQSNRCLSKQLLCLVSSAKPMLAGSMLHTCLSSKRAHVPSTALSRLLTVVCTRAPAAQIHTCTHTPMSRRLRYSLTRFDTPAKDCLLGAPPTHQSNQLQSNMQC